MRLHVSGEAGIFFGDYVCGLQITSSLNPHGIPRVLRLHPDFLQPLQQRAEVSRLAAGDVEIAVGESARNDEGSGFDAVGNNAMLCAPKLGYS